MTFTNEQSMLLLARAICELADGDLEGAGVAHARNLSALAARGRGPDPLIPSAAENRPEASESRRGSDQRDDCRRHNPSDASPRAEGCARKQ